MFLSLLPLTILLIYNLIYALLSLFLDAEIRQKARDYEAEADKYLKLAMNPDIPADIRAVARSAYAENTAEKKKYERLAEDVVKRKLEEEEKRKLEKEEKRKLETEMKRVTEVKREAERNMEEEGKLSFITACTFLSLFSYSFILLFIFRSG